MLRGRRRRNDEHKLAADFCRRAALRQRFKVAAADLFVQLSQLATDCGLALAQSGRKVGERGGNPRPGLEQHDGGRQAREFGDAGAARRLFGRQKAGEQKLIRGQARNGQGCEHGRRPWQRRDGMAGVLGGTHQLVPGSEISGVPASDTSAIAAPSPSRRNSAGRACAALWSW